MHLVTIVIVKEKKTLNEGIYLEGVGGRVAGRGLRVGKVN